MKRLSFYLVGPIQYVEDYLTWREKMADFLEDLGHTAEMPWGEIYHSKKMKNLFLIWLKEMRKRDWIRRVRKYMRSQVIRFDLNTLLKSDGIIFYLPTNTKTAGSYGEQTLAYYLKKWKDKGKRMFQGKRIFVIAEGPLEELSYWLIGCSDELFFSMRTFKTYFKKNFNRNINRRRKKKK